MANTVNVNVLENGDRNVILHVFLQSDGSTGELVATNLITPAALGMLAGSKFRLSRIDYNFAGFDAVIEFGSGGVAPNYKWVLVESANNPVDFGPYNLIFDNSGIDGTGALQITTYGFTSTTDVGSMLIRLVK